MDEKLRAFLGYSEGDFAALVERVRVEAPHLVVARPSQGETCETAEIVAAWATRLADEINQETSAA